MFKVTFYPHSLPTSSKLDDFNISGSISFLCSVILVYSRLLCCGFDINAHFRHPSSQPGDCQKELSKSGVAVFLDNKTNGAAEDITVRR